MKLSDRLKAQGIAVPAPRAPGAPEPVQEVSRTPEFDRIERLPRRVLDVDNVVDLTPLYRRDPLLCTAAPGTCDICAEGARLRPIQSAALWEIAQAEGLFAPIGVGFGKTLISLLAADVLEAERPVLIVPAQLKAQLLLKNIPELGRHFKLPTVTVVSYHDLSSAATADMLDRLLPDVVIADEAHNLRHMSASRSKRFFRYMRKNPGTKFVALSGSMTTSSIKDYAALLERSLGAASPVPRGAHYHDLCDWADALDADVPAPMPPGALMRLCTPQEQARVSTGLLSPTDAARAGFQRRLVETPGVVATSQSAIGTALVITGRYLKLPTRVLGELQTLRRTWSIGGEEIQDGATMARVCREVAGGWYYRWRWPGGVPDQEWLDARAAWFRRVRHQLQHAARPGADSPGLLEEAAREGRWPVEEWAPWEAVRDRYRPHPPVDTVWLDDFLVRDAVAWGRALEGVDAGIIWYEFGALGRAIARAGGFPLFEGGDDEKLALASPLESPIIVCSIKAHGEGKNLQGWCRNLITTPPANGKTWEQLLGRTHRPGQKADQVDAEVYLYTHELRDAFTGALADARYIEGTIGQRQKLLYAMKVGI